MTRIPLKGGDEYDALTRARRFYKYLSRSKTCKAIKRKYNRRFRQETKRLIETERTMA